MRLFDILYYVFIVIQTKAKQLEHFENNVRILLAFKKLFGMLTALMNFGASFYSLEFGEVVGPQN